VITALTLKKNC